MMQRREFLGASMVGAIGAGVVRGSALAHADNPPAKGRLKQSVCRWCYAGTAIEDLCKHASAMGLASVELLGPDEWDVPKRHGMVCAVAANVKSNPIPRGFNRVEHHDAIIKDLEERLPLVNASGIPQQIVFSGNRAGLSDAEGLANCAKGLRRITPLAEALSVTIIMELLNSKVDHKDYQCDKTPWGAALVAEVASPRFKLLYDIYHMQIMEGDVIRTITEHFGSIAHYHTGGVPGRGIIDGTQELCYHAICTALAQKRYGGFVGQEFMPGEDAMGELRRAVEICSM